ncbi:ftsK/SpoIIIE family protein [Mycobacterium xenopi 3993]|nr:ftsK/SpoIIIE family protein [Mycobacterium xenopi 3993]
MTFYCLDYGGGQLRVLEDLAHVGSVASPLEPERIRRTFGELEQLLLSRQRREVFRDRRGNGSGLTTATARCFWSSTTSTRSAAITPTSSTPETRCWPR